MRLRKVWHERAVRGGRASAGFNDARAEDHAMTGLAIESATDHVELRVESREGEVLAERVEEIGLGHTRRLAPLIRETLAEASVTVRDLTWIAADLGPGSFTGVRVGLATATALAMVSRAQLLGAASLQWQALA